MARRRTQRYRLEVEFLLRDRSDYALVRNVLRSTLLQLSTDIELAIEFMSIEATEETRIEPTRTPEA